MNQPHLLLAIVALSGCVLDFSEIGPQQSGSGGSGAGGQAQGAAAQGGEGGTPIVVVQCAAEQCVPIPDDFVGAVQLQLSPDDSTAVLCGGTELLFEGQEGMETAADASCNCACVASGTCAVGAQSWGNSTCTPGAGTALNLGDEGACTPVPTGIDSIKANGPLPQGAACASDGADDTVPPVVFHGYARGCRFESEGCPTDSVCNAPSPDARTCFYREALEDDAVCPDGLTRYDLLRRGETLDDDRSCVCNCVNLGADCDTPVLRGFNDSGCLQPGSMATGSCLGSSAMMAVQGTANIQVECELTENVSGSARLHNTLLVCCL